jgi:hypothetical protein
VKSDKTPLKPTPEQQAMLIEEIKVLHSSMLKNPSALSL